MFWSGRVSLRAVSVLIGSGVLWGLVGLMGSAAYAQPTPTPTPAPAAPAPGCTAADLAQVSAGVASATSDYLFNHPDVNDFFTSLHGKPNGEIPTDVQNYFNTNPQARADLTAIRQPLVDLRTRCQEA